MDTRAAAVLADDWFARLSAPAMPIAHADDALAAPDALALLVARLLDDGQRVLLLVPDDDLLPAISSALDLAIRPLCLVLPAADFAARIALRATLSLLRSRLARDSDDEQTPAWQAQRERIAAATSLWQAAQDWNARNDRSDWPDAVAGLFPAGVLPIAAWRALPHQPADVAIFFRCHPGIDAIGLGGRQLRIGPVSRGDHRAVAPADETARLQAELRQLTLDVGELELELATAQGEMSDFTRRYYRQVGRRLAEVDALQARLARLRAQTVAAAPGVAGLRADEAAARAFSEAAHAQQRADRSAAEEARFREAEAAVPPDEARFTPATDVKKLFRQLAQRIHPDRAANDDDRAWRTQLMSEANRAYRANDLAALNELAALWREGRPVEAAAPAVAAATSISQLQAQIARMRCRFDELRDQLGRLFGSRLYELFLAARQALRHGRDLLQDMADRLDAQIADLLAALAALDPPARA